MFAVHPHLAGVTLILHLPGMAVGSRLGDLFVGGMTEGRSIVFNPPNTLALCDGQDRPFRNCSHPFD